MALNYRKPGVYLEEAPLNNPPSEVGAANAAGVFVGVTQKGPINDPIRIESWSDFVTLFGGFSSVTGDSAEQARIPTAVHIAGSTGQLSSIYAQKGDLAFVNPYRGSASTFYKYDGADTALPGFSEGHDIYVWTGFNWQNTGYTFNSFSPLFEDRDAIIGAVANTRIVFVAQEATADPLDAPLGTFNYGDLVLRWDADASPGRFRLYIRGDDSSRFGNQSAANTGGYYTGGSNTNYPIALETGWVEITEALSSSLDDTYRPDSGTRDRSWGLFTHDDVAAPGYVPTSTALSLADPPGPGGVDAAWASWEPVIGEPAQSVPSTAFSYLPYSVYSYFQNGGRVAYIVRSTASSAGAAAEATYTDGNVVDPTTAFVVQARGAGAWADTGLAVNVVRAESGDGNTVFTLRVLLNGGEVERFPNLSIDGLVPGTKRIDVSVNDPYSGSRYVRITSVNVAVEDVDFDAANTPRPLSGGEDPGLPGEADLVQSAIAGVGRIDGPVLVNVVGYTTDRSDAHNYVTATVRSSDFGRPDAFIIQDNARRRAIGESASVYANSALATLTAIPADSQVAAYAPWIVVQDPTVAGGTITVPPGGAVMGVMARIDATIGVFRAPAGLIASITNAVGVDVKFTDTDLGNLNNRGVNIIRPMVGAGMCVMGARTRKLYGADRYVSVRRTLIYINEMLKASTEFAIFENSDQRLWNRLSATADRILRPIWEAGGLKGGSAAEAYYIRCDDRINTPSVVASGEVRMEVGVALETPAEFVVIKVSQYDNGTFTTEVQPSA